MPKISSKSSSPVVDVPFEKFTRCAYQQSRRFYNIECKIEKITSEAEVFEQRAKLCGYSITTHQLRDLSKNSQHDRTKRDNSTETKRDERSMSCLTTRYKLITLCCFVTLVAIISSAMVINAFLNWSPAGSNVATDKAITKPDNTHSDLSTSSESSIPPNTNGLDMQIEIDEITTSPLKSTEARRKWFELQKYNSKNKQTPGIITDVIDIDDESTEEISGSGVDDNERESNPVTILPLPTRVKLQSPKPQIQTAGVDNSVSKNTRDNTVIVSSHNERPSTESADLPPSADIETSRRPPSTTLNGETFTEDRSTNKFGGETDFSLDGMEHTHLSIVEGVSSYHIGSPVTPANLPDEDKCDRWLNCEDPFLKSYIDKFALLPTCPCEYPLDRGNDVYDLYHKKVFSWKNSRYSQSYLFAYHKGATRCIRSQVGAGTLAAQNCCYDKQNHLLTRGSGAGTPDVISPDVSEALHQLVDNVPWILCGGDWTKYNIARPPNNMRLCPKNPPQMEYLYQIWLVKNQ